MTLKYFCKTTRVCQTCTQYYTAPLCIPQHSLVLKITSCNVDTAHCTSEKHCCLKRDPRIIVVTVEWYFVLQSITLYSRVLNNINLLYRVMVWTSDCSFLLWCIFVCLVSPNLFTEYYFALQGVVLTYGTPICLTRYYFVLQGAVRTATSFVVYALSFCTT